MNITTEYHKSLILPAIKSAAGIRRPSDMFLVPRYNVKRMYSRPATIKPAWPVEVNVTTEQPTVKVVSSELDSDVGHDIRHGLLSLSCIVVGIILAFWLCNIQSVYHLLGR